MPGLHAVFLDRDGVIIDDVHYLARFDQVRLIPGAATAIRRLNQAAIPVVVVTNQSGVARGLFPESFVPLVHAHLSELLADWGAHIDRFYYCPHHPDKGIEPYVVDCCCRKPKPGMLHQAATEMGLNLARSWMIGDKLSDLQAGSAAGCRTILVRTGHGKETVLPNNTAALNLAGDARSLPEAIDIILVGSAIAA
jgi:D-glycero-D-manno-heptose 1,7-bisphosphate phosphatase